MMPHRYQEGMKRFISHIMRLSGDIRGKKNLVWDFIVVKGWGWSEGIPHTTKAWVVWTSCQCQRRGRPRFSYSLPRCEGEGKGDGLKLKSCHQVNLKNGVRLFIIVGWSQTIVHKSVYSDLCHCWGFANLEVVQRKLSAVGLGLVSPAPSVAGWVVDSSDVTKVVQWHLNVPQAVTRNSDDWSL